MKYVDEFRGKDAALRIASAIGEACRRDIVIMEVCGTHTMSIARFGIKSLLPKKIHLISGPGCPVCVTPSSYIDEASQILNKGACICTFGDLVRVPGVKTSLEIEKANGKDVRVVSSTLDALKIAANEPGKEVVFLGVGFETTAPTIAASIISAKKTGVKNYSVLCAHKLVPPAIQAILSGPVKIDALILPGHVTTVIGTKPYESILRDKRVISAVAGFEPTDILSSILEILNQMNTENPHVANLYRRVVSEDGNPAMMQMLEDIFEPCSAVWRGIGLIEKSGLSIKKEFSEFDAAKKFNVVKCDHKEPNGCRCGEVLTGRIGPEECKLFGTTCTPANPVGACMVSSEGTCAAHYKYGRR